MTAPNNPKPGRNQPCPCGSGEKYKLCCASPRAKAMRDELMRSRILVHMLLCKVQELTGEDILVIPKQDLVHYPSKFVYAIVGDQEADTFRLHATPIQKPLIEAPRRIVLPR